MSEKTAVTVGLTNKVLEVLGFDQNEFAPEDVPSAVQAAIVTYAQLREEIDQGGEFYLRNESGEMRRVRFPFQSVGENVG